MELSQRTALAARIRDLCLEKLRPLPRSIAVFGSFARGALTESSDLDLLLVGDAIPRKPYARTLWFGPVITAYRAGSCVVPLAPLFLSEQGFADAIGLRLSLSGEAWVLWDDGFLCAGLHEAARLIAEKKWRKELLADGGWLWIPKGAAA